MYHLIRFFILIFIIFSFSLLHAQIKPMGLQSLYVKSISLAQATAYPSKILVAATPDSGVLYYQLGMDCGWQNIGLEGLAINDIYVQVNGTGPSDYYKVYAGMRPSSVDSTLIYAKIIGTDSAWTAADSGLKHQNLYSVDDMDGLDYSGHEPPTPLYAVIDGYLYRSTTSWQQIPFERLFAEFVNVVNDSMIWTGGSGVTMSPILFKSENAGADWIDMGSDLCDFGCDNSCFSLAAFPDQADTVYLGMGEHILKSTESGNNWQSTGLKNIQAGFYGVAVNPLNSQHIVTYSHAETSFVYQSFDGGQTFEMIANPMPSFKISEMSSGIFEQEFVVFFATTNGVYSYSSTPQALNQESVSGDPVAASLMQNYPNPFNNSTVLSYRLLGAGHVQIELYNMLGQKTQMLIDKKQTAGHYQFLWDASHLSSGVYYCRISFNQRYIQTRKMLLLR